MNQHLSGAGPIAVRRIRSLLAFRHEYPVAQLVSTPIASAVATLLVVRSGQAYADSGVLDAGAVLLGGGLLALLTASQAPEPSPQTPD